MKPDWKDAPEWAKWLAYHKENWYWCESRPVIAGDPWGSGSRWISCVGRKMMAVTDHMKFENSIERRPEAK